MKFFQKRGVAAAVLVLAIVLSSIYGLSRAPVRLPDVEYTQWVYDGTNVISDKTEQIIDQCNTAWDDAYYAICAVASVDSMRGWDQEEYSLSLGEQWGLGTNDMILILVTGSDGPSWYMNGGNAIMSMITESEINRLQSALDAGVYAGNYDEAVLRAFSVINEIYAEHYGATPGIDAGESYYDYGGNGWQNTSGAPIASFLLVLLAIFVIWIILDRMRYNRYRRRYVLPGMGRPTVLYRPIFWGRRPSVLYNPMPHAGGGYRPPTNNNHKPTSGGSYRPPTSGSYRPPTSSGNKPFSGSSPRPGGFSGSGSKPSSGNSGRHSGFGGGSRGGFSSSGRSSSGSSGRSSFGGGRSSFGSGSRGSFGGGRSGGFGGGSRGGFGGGKR